MIRRLVLASLALFLAALARGADVPAYVREALSHFTSDAPKGWAYTLTTTKDGQTSVERYDPSQPVGAQWTLLRRDGRAPTAEESRRYTQYKTGTTQGSTRAATFERNDLDLASLKLVREDAERAEFESRFREGDDQMLAHFVVALTFAKHPAVLEKFTLRLDRPFSPVVGLRMKELVVDMEFSPATADRPSLPRRSSSVFHGRFLLFKAIDEDLRIAYSDYVRVTVK
ncbi:MAG: hypothetical protein HY302_12995 [Opitutae bacterium]|nr:hypothetical protein [Opitutae bacterium]